SFPPPPPQIADDAEIDLHQLIRTITDRKRTLLGITVALALLGALIGWTISAYTSVGYFQLGISVPDFRKLQSTVAAPGHWDNFLKTYATKTKPEADLTEIGPLLSQEKSADQMIQPIYPFSKNDLKNLAKVPDIANGTDIVGIKISARGATASDAQTKVIALGNFLRDSAILLDFKTSARTKYAQHLADQQINENKTIDTKYQLTQLDVRKSDMQKILHTYPDSTNSDRRQLVSVSGDSARYLSPVTQLVAIESTIDEQKQKLPAIEREERINTINVHYYEKVLAYLSKSTSGTAFLHDLPKIRDELHLNLDDPVEKLAFNQISIDALKANATYFEQARFIAQPTKPSAPSPGVFKAGLLGLLLGLFVGCGYILLAAAFKNSSIIKE
ncbi:MAG: hypothetical protein ABI351_05020, partial [Herbaspirillum sp.]